MKKLIIILSILLIAVPAFSADYAVVKEVSGRVEVQSPGGSWVRASAGDSLAQGASISTGFGASAIIEVGASVLNVDALTRMKLEELVQDRGTQTTGLFLRVGRVNAEVKRDEGLSHNFKLRSPSSTAAVRGTNFTYVVSDKGSKVIVHKGLVALIRAALAREVLVSANEWSVDGSNPADEAEKNSSTQGNPVQTDNDGQGGTGQNGGGVELYGNIVITVE
ncbi:MAG: FecR domain-containing protein [Spirochaetales bacterium]|nr:FecR domain-containing protein [Spirochaetales bacterium]